ncbi:MAG: zinc transporter ZupT [Promethearchaeota archaeon]
MESVWLALLLSTIAGLSTTIGSFVAFFMKKPSPRLISFIMGFSAGVMILISFVELLHESIASIGFLQGLLFFFLGMIIMFFIDVFVSHQYEFEESIEMLVSENGSCESHIHHGHQHRQKQRYQVNNKNQPLLKATLFIFLGVFIHNFPEGMATFIGSLKEIRLGILLTVAIALHNIPEGIAVAVPLFACTESKGKAFRWSFLSGISEPLGALITWLILFPFITDFTLSAMLGVVAGIMIYISLDELLPVSRSFAKEHYSIIGIITGMFIMSLSLVIL